ncbi:MAG: hypothetical protein JSV56_11790 [Methanomassiliicoccales archaeon]|nr:MAG: hypothetical protein JSV56_11790 [Methanomassiliicoccales archaeon]
MRLSLLKGIYALLLHLEEEKDISIRGRRATFERIKRYLYNILYHGSLCRGMTW